MANIGFNPSSIKYPNTVQPQQGQNNDAQTNATDGNNVNGKKFTKEQSAANCKEVESLMAKQGEYIKASAENIVAMSQKEMKKELSLFDPQHRKLAQYTTSTKFANAKTDAEQKSAISEMKSKTAYVIQGFKDLIQKENDALKKAEKKGQQQNLLGSNDLRNNPSVSQNSMSMQGSLFSNRNLT